MLRIVDENGNKITDTSFDTLLTYNTNEECIEAFNNIKNELSLKKSEARLVEKCLRCLNTPLESKTNFSPGDILSLHVLSNIHLSKSDEIMACADFMHKNFEFKGEMNDEFLDMYMDVLRTSNTVFYSGAKRKNLPEEDKNISFKPLSISCSESEESE
jgi:hypothetical protein